MAKTRTVAGAGTLGAALLVLIFGSQPVAEWVDRHTSSGSAWGWFMRVLTWPRWAVGPDDNTSAAMRKLLSQDLRALLLILFVALILAFAAKGVTGGGPAFILGWAALIFAAALAAFATAFILASPTLRNALEVAAAAAGFGLFAGWLVGIITATGKAAG